MAETLLAESSFAMRDGYEIRDSQELLAFAAANLGAGMVGCCPVNGSVSRSSMKCAVPGARPRRCHWWQQRGWRRAAVGQRADPAAAGAGADGHRYFGPAGGGGSSTWPTGCCGRIGRSWPFFLAAFLGVLVLGVYLLNKVFQEKDKQ